MTIEEAIRAIRHDLHWNLLKGYQEDVAKIAISALERQIPKKPIRLPANHPFYYEVGDCPTCGVSVYVSDGKNCSQCGQKIDWSETDD